MNFKVFALLRRGWFPFSYTRVLPDSDGDKLKVKYVHVARSCTVAAFGLEL